MKVSTLIIKKLRAQGVSPKNNHYGSILATLQGLSGIYKYGFLSEDED